MKVLHWAFVLIAIILPTSIICRNLVNTRFTVLKDEVRINNAIDTATKDAIDQIIAVSGFDYDDEFGDVINITPELAQESINTFFHTMAVNYNMSYKTSDSSEIEGDRTNSYIKNYFASYIPAVVVIAYDGFYVYSVDQTESGYYGYRLSSKRPYTVDCGDYIIGYTLGNDIYLYPKPSRATDYDTVCYSGRLKFNSYQEIVNEFEENYTDALGAAYTPDLVAALTNDMDMVIYSLIQNGTIRTNTKYIQPDPTINNFLENFEKKDLNGKYIGGAFHDYRRENIIKIISDCLNAEFNEHNNYADLVGITYDFNLPTINEDDWVNSINDICIMAFVQGIPMVTAHGTYFNNYALGGSQIVKRDYIYGAKYGASGAKLYHKPHCPLISGDNYQEIFIDREDAIAAGYVACQRCH